MGKRFTETTKWDDAWFVELKAEFKLAWLYLCDCCDCAGVVDLSRRLADFRIGVTIDWEEFVNATNGRVEMLDSGKLWLVGFCDFQYGTLSEDANPHRPVIRSLKSNALFERVSEGYLKGSQDVMDKDKDKDKDKDIDGGVGEDWDLPPGWDLPEVRKALDDWAAMRRRKGKPIRSKQSTSKLFKKFRSPEHLIEVAEFCEANEYQGLKPEYCQESRKPTPAQKTAKNATALLGRLK